MYSQGSSEEILGRALKDFANRDEVVIATKVRHPMRPGPNGAGSVAQSDIHEIDHSLRRLGTDYIDLYQIHRLDNSTPIEETLEALHDVVKAGKARYLGASSMHAWEFSQGAAPAAPARLDAVRLDAGSLQPARSRGGARNAAAVHRRGRSARSCGARLPEGASPVRAKSTNRSGSDPFADMLYTQESSDRAIIDAVASIAKSRGVSRAQSVPGVVAAQPVVVAPYRRRNQGISHGRRRGLARIALTDEEVARLEAPYTPRYDFQGVSDDAELARISVRLGIKPAGS